MPDPRIVRHVLLGRFRPGTTVEQIRVFTAGFQELTRKIDGVLSFESGVNNSPEGLNRGLTHVCVITFADEQARDAYLPHPEHLAFGRWAAQLDIVEEMLVVDYTPQT